MLKGEIWWAALPRARGSRTGENPSGVDCPKRYDEPQFGKYGHVRIYHVKP